MKIPSRLSFTIIAALAGLHMEAADAQHFAKPTPIDPTAVRAIGDPIFTIARSTTSFGSVSADGWLYVMGGYTGRPHDYYHEGQSKDFYRINVLDPSHIESLPDTEGLQSSPLEHWDGMVIRTGGMVAENARGEPQVLRSLDAARAYDTRTRSWTDLPSLPIGRSSHDSAIIGSKLFVIGGWTLDPDLDSREWHSTMHVIDLSDPDSGWSSIDAPFQRRAFASVAVGTKMVCIGGLTPERRSTNEVDVFDSTTGAWTKGPEFPGASFGLAAEGYDGIVYASGSDGVIYAWDLLADSDWQPVATLTFPRFFHQIAADGSGNLLVIGGTARGVRPTHVERVSIDGTGPTDPIIAHWRVPSPSAAKNRQGMFIEDGWLYAFGGNNSTGQHDFQPENFLDEGFRLSLSGLMWQELPNMPSPRQSIQTVHTSEGDHALAVGGFAHDGEVARTFDDAFLYGFDDRAWIPMGSVMPVPRSQFGLVEHGGTYWAFGGLDYDSRRAEGDHFRHLTTVLSADTNAEMIRFEDSGVELPRPRRAFGGAKANGKYFLVGGMRENFTIVEECDAFDFETRSFERISSPARPRLSPTLVELGGKLYLAGGSSPRADGTRGLEPNSSIEAYDPQTDTWSTVVDEIPISPRHMRMMPFRGRLLLVSSHVDEFDMTHLVLIDPHWNTGRSHAMTGIDPAGD